MDKVASIFAVSKSKMKKAMSKVKKEVKGDESWEVVDSGSVDNVADCKKEFPKHTIKTSKAQQQGVEYLAASGATIPNEGETVVDAVDAAGTPMPRMTFHNAKVGMPILSVRKLCKKGARVEFHDKGGVIKLLGGKVTPFVLKHGVYFVRLFIQNPDDPSMPGFTGQGS